MSRAPDQQLTHFLSDLYSMELQAIAQLVSAPAMAKDPVLAADFKAHHHETEGQAELVRERLESTGGSPSSVKDGIMKLGGKGFLLFAKMQPETPGKLLAHAYSYEAMEWAAYASLIRMSEQSGDTATAEVGRKIMPEERLMMDRLEKRFDAAEAVSHDGMSVDELRNHIHTHLNEAHALATQSIELLDKGTDITTVPELGEVYANQLNETRGHVQQIGERLEAIGSDESTIKDAALKIGALNWSIFFKSQSDTPAKLLTFVYAVTHLEIAGYELLKRTALRAEDPETRQLCETILSDKRAMANELAEHIDLAALTTLQAVGPT